MSEPVVRRVAFVGQSVYFEQCVLARPAGGLDPSFIDFRFDAPTEPLLARLREIDPDVIVVFRPEIIPAHLFDEFRGIAIGFLTEPLPRGQRRSHGDLRARLEWLSGVDPGNFDRIVSFDPLMADTASSVIPVWRSQPIPVADEMFRDVAPRGERARILFVGRSTEYREGLLAPVKERHQVIHIGHGLFGPLLDRFLADTDVQINLHNNPYPTFENRVSIALAGGHLVISEPLSPDHGLRAGRDYLEIASAEELEARVAELVADPHAYVDVQRSGRAEAERFRASTVYPALIDAAVADIAAVGTGRRRAPIPA